MSGTLHGLGLGPGDPELITLRSWRVISLAPVIAYPEGPSGRSRVRSIAAPFMPDDVEELPLSIPFGATGAVLEDAYDRAAAIISARLDEGKDVALLCLGDPLTYGTFGKLAARLARSHPVRVTPGISAPQAAAARVGRTLVEGNQPLKLLPATMDEDMLLAECMNRHAALAILKVGENLSRVCDALVRSGRLDQALVVEELDGADERVLPLREALSSADGEARYFSLVLVWPRA